MKIKSLIVLLVSGVSCLGADLVKISELPSTNVVTSADILPIVANLATTPRTYRILYSDLIGNSGLSNYVANAGDGITITSNTNISTKLLGAGAVTLSTNGSGVITITGSDSTNGYANPTGTVGLAAVNGVAATSMRSDAAPALSQAIAPTWTGVHTFDNYAVFQKSTRYSINNHAYAATIDINLDGTLPDYRSVTLTGNLELTVSNKAAGRWFTIILIGDGSDRTLTLPWTKYMNQAEPTSLAANKTAALTVLYLDGTDANAVVNYAVMP
jgi:hypothetical protein